MRLWFNRRKLIVALVAATGLMAIVAATAGPSSAESPMSERPGDISSGEFATCATTATGSVQCRSYPGWTNVDGIEDAIAVSVSTNWFILTNPRLSFGCALRSDGAVWCWGQGENSSSDSQTTPGGQRVERMPGITDAVAVAAGSQSACALDANGAVLCWAKNYRNQADGSSPQSLFSEPTQIPGISNATAISSGCAVVDAGSIKCWSLDLNGNVTGVSRWSGISDALSLSHGAGDTCVVHRDGRVSCGVTDTGEPVYVAGVAGAVEASTFYWSDDVDYGDGIATDWGKCALIADGTITCWNKDNPTPGTVAGIENATAVAASRSRSCATVSGGQVSCWDNDSLAPPCLASAVESSTTDSYWLLQANGSVAGFGGASDLCGVSLDSDIQAAAIAQSADGTGLWILDSSGVVHVRGSATGYGNVGALAPGDTVTAISVAASDQGYWVFTARGSVYAFGDAQHYGDLPTQGISPVGSIVSSAATRSGNGYYMLGADGGVFAFGDATFAGSVPQVLPGVVLNCPIVGLVPVTAGDGYWVVACDGGVFAFGGAEFNGSIPGVLAAGQSLNAPINGMVPYGDGYLMAASDGGVFNFSDGPFLTSLGNLSLASPVVAIAAFTS